MQYRIGVGQPEGTKLVIVKATCDKDGYSLMQEAVSSLMQYAKNMKVNIKNDIATPRSIERTLEFVSEASAKKFFDRIPKLKN